MVETLPAIARMLCSGASRDLKNQVIGHLFKKKNRYSFIHLIETSQVTRGNNKTPRYNTSNTGHVTQLAK